MIFFSELSLKDLKTPFKVEQRTVLPVFSNLCKMSKALCYVKIYSHPSKKRKCFCVSRSWKKCNSENVQGEKSAFVYHCISQINSRSQCLSDLYSFHHKSIYISCKRKTHQWCFYGLMRIGRSLTFVVYHCDIIISLCFGISVCLLGHSSPEASLEVLIAVCVK